MATSKEIWETLSVIDVSEYAEKLTKKYKDKTTGEWKSYTLTYISWAWAWGTLMKNFPQAKYEILNPSHGKDGTVMVETIVSIDETTRSMWLPVMDSKNNAIINPDMRSISDSQMRCLTKCIAMFGLGHYIYAGEDLPASDDEIHQVIRLIDEDIILFYVSVLGLPSAERNDAYNSFPKGEKTKGKKMWDEAFSEGKQEFENLLNVCVAYIEKDDDLGFKESVEDLDPVVKQFLWSHFEGEIKEAAKEMLK